MAMIHGGDIYRNYVKSDFSVNINPLGIPEKVKTALCDAVAMCGRYPDPEAEALKRAVAAMLAVPEEYFLFGNGASELFMAIMHGIKPKKTLIPVPSFYGYEYAAEAVGGEIIYYEMRREDAFGLNDRLPVFHRVKMIDLPSNQCVDGWPPKDFSIVRNGGQGERDLEAVPYGKIPAPAKVPEMIPGEPRQLHLHLLKMGNIALLLANAELFAEIGRDMKAASPYRNTIIITHHYGKKCNYIFDKTSKDVLLPMAYGGVVPGSSDELIVNGERDLFDEILEKE